MVRISRLGKLFDVFRSKPGSVPVSKSHIAQVLSLYPRGEVGELISHVRLGGDYSHSFLLRTALGQKVRKKYPHHSPVSILPEHSTLTFLAAQDSPAPRLVPNMEGQTYSVINDQYRSQQPELAQGELCPGQDP